MLKENDGRPFNILLVDDHPIVRFGFISLLKATNDAAVFYEADTQESALKMVSTHPMDVALVDLSLAGKLSLDLIKTMHAISPSTAILIVSMHDEKLYAERGLKAGARGYVMKQVAAKAIIKAVQCVQEGNIWLSEAFHIEILNRLADSRATGKLEGFQALSDRELAVFRLIGLGMKKSEIAKELNLSPNTVETYRSNIKTKMGIENGAALYRTAFIHFQYSPT